MNPLTLYTDITDASIALNLNLNNTQIQSLVDYALLLHKWNAAYNLSAFKTLPDIVVKHLFDCMAIVQPIIQTLSIYPAAMQTVLDVGTGAGLPGIVLAICIPNSQFTLLDSIQKKILFIHHAIAILRLNNIQAYSGRIQDWQGQYSIVTARAWTDLADIALLTEHCIYANGCIAAMKGPKLMAESVHLPAHWHIKSTIKLNVPHLNEDRKLVFLERLY